MISRGFLAVVKMHIKQQLLSRAFVVSTLLMPAIMFGVIFVQTQLANLDRAEKSHIFVTSDDEQLLSTLQDGFNELDEVKEGVYTIDYQYVVGPAFDDYLTSKRPAILADANNGLFFVPAQAASDKEVRFYSTNVGNQVLRQNIGSVVNAALNLRYFSSLNVAAADLDYAVKNIAIKGFTVSETGEEQGSAGNMIVGFGLAFLLIISMMGIVMPFSAVIIEEKTNRAVEVLLTSVNPAELLAGKIAARAVTGVAQMLVWLVPVLVFILFPALIVLPPELRIDIGFGTLLFFLANYVLGLTTLLAIWGGFSAMFDSTQDAGQALWPVTLLMWMPFYAVFAVLRNPANSVAEILSMIPFTSLYVMPLRLAVVEVPLWQPLLALLLNALLVWGAVAAGGKIYRISILATGQQPTFSQFVGWLRQS